MANQLKMVYQKAIVALAERGWSYRRIARELGIHRETVSRYVKLSRSDPSPVKYPTTADSKPAKVALGSRVLKSRCEPHRETIKGKLTMGLTAKRIWQDLQEEHGFEGSYGSVKRFVRSLRAVSPLPFRRMESEPGAEAQVDFGRGAPVRGPEGKRRYPHVLRVVLSHSRKGYSEVVWRQGTEEFIRCLEDAFRHFGGVPKTLVIDNLRAAVKRADWFDPELNPKIVAFREHYGTVILPTRPATPRHKGKVERGIGYVRGNALRGREFSSLQEENLHLREWERKVADTRIHGTIRKQVGRVFEEVERPALGPLPHQPFPFFHEARRSVHRDGHVEVAKAYYSVPPEHVGRRVWVRWNARLVRLFSDRMEQIAIHVRQEPGRFSTRSLHIASEKISGVERGAAWLLAQVRQIGPQSGRWAEAMLRERGIQGVRVLMGLLGIAKRHPRKEVEKACEIAASHGAYRLRTIRELIKRKEPKQEELELTVEHPIIRSLADYEKLVRESLHKGGLP